MIIIIQEEEEGEEGKRLLQLSAFTMALTVVRLSTNKFSFENVVPEYMAGLFCR